MNGFIVINKPAGITSHDVVSSVRKILRMKKVGHTGTLDPFATGVLPIALGEATKAINYLDESVKEYLAVMRLGITTDSQDYTGNVVRERDYQNLTQTSIEQVFSSFVGALQQIPPMFSAVKQSGIRLYKLARQGVDVEREPRDINIVSINLEKIDLPNITFRVCCSRGTYVRTLANDIGDKLGCGAHLTELHRTKSGIFTEDESVTLEKLAMLNDHGLVTDHVMTPHFSLSHLRDIPLTDQGVVKIRQGVLPSKNDFQVFPMEGFFDGERVLFSYKNALLAVAEVISTQWSDDVKNMRFLRVFN
jgi:tRNA pseudouridine55 synthase